MNEKAAIRGLSNKLNRLIERVERVEHALGIDSDPPEGPEGDREVEFTPVAEAQSKPLDDESREAEGKGDPENPEGKPMGLEDWNP